MRADPWGTCPPRQPPRPPAGFRVRSGPMAWTARTLPRSLPCRWHRRAAGASGPGRRLRRAACSPALDRAVTWPPVSGEHFRRSVRTAGRRGPARASPRTCGGFPRRAPA
ncbi:hypothetical protein ACFFX0_14640 [Citricoccus parietis]|uniref:Uncharacterized protein n=1 Tax=Citricoccus parietis TaxID=592307 RepID=A0ABV5G0A1_9MICC